MTDHLIIGTRGSALALVQSHWVREQIQAAHPSLDIHVLIIQTQGDLSQATNTPLASYSEKGVFAKELEIALLNGDVDVAVHSMKDLASALPEGLHIAAVPEREDVRDAVLGISLPDLPSGSRVGTGSVRRQALLKELRPDLQILDIRGNVDTRISKLKNGEFDSIILAVAGLNRLGRSEEIVEILDPARFVPDPGQGALAVQTRTDDDRVNGIVSPLSHRESFIAITAERAFLASFGGGCQTPVGAWATVNKTQLKLTVMVALNESAPKRLIIFGGASRAEFLGHRAAKAISR